MAVYATEITSDQEPSDGPIHHRLLKPYVVVADWVQGNLLEVGCGEGRGIELLLPKAKTFTALDKIEPVLEGLRKKFPAGKFTAGHFPPFQAESEAFDGVVSFQVIEHIQNDRAFLKEIYRVLKPGGRAWITTPNRPMSLTRNPWHIREYTGQELLALAKQTFSEAIMRGITGNGKVMDYHEKNRKSVERITRWDIFNLQHNLPAPLLRVPYEILNRLNRKKLKAGNEGLVSGITHTDYVVTDHADGVLDLFLEVRK